jgi:hypothetical protein
MCILQNEVHNGKLTLQGARELYYKVVIWLNAPEAFYFLLAARQMKINVIFNVFSCGHYSDKAKQLQTRKCIHTSMHLYTHVDGLLRDHDFRGPIFYCYYGRARM